MSATDPRFQLPDPVLLVSYPKSGNTWVRMFLSNYLADAVAPLAIDDLRFFRHIAHPTVFERLVGYSASDLPPDRVQSLRVEMHSLLRLLMPGSPCFKVHDAFHLPDGRALFPPGVGRVVYLLRNPLDVCVSWNHFFGVDDTERTAAIMAGQSITRQTAYPPGSVQLRQHYGSWSHHVTGWTEAPDINRLVLRYEDLRADPHGWFGAVLSFLGLPVDPQRLDRAIVACRFERVRAAEQQTGFSERYDAARPFFRSGTTGEGQRTLPASVISRLLQDHGAVMARFGYLD